jgi:hypothetical protein
MAKELKAFFRKAIPFKPEVDVPGDFPTMLSAVIVDVVNG